MLLSSSGLKMKAAWFSTLHGRITQKTTNFIFIFIRSKRYRDTTEIKQIKDIEFLDVRTQNP
jgi:hypothetical protein